MPGPAGPAALFALLALIVLGGVAVTCVLGRDAGPGRPATDTALRQPWAAALSGGAAVIHALVVPEHLRAERAHGIFFLVLAVGQLGLAAVLFRGPGRLVVRLAVAVSLWVSVLWLLSRTTDIALVTTREPVGVLDVTSTLLQLLLAAACLRRLRGTPH